MAQLNILACNSASTNTGRPFCDFSEGVSNGIVLIPANKTFSSTELAAFETVLLQLFKSAVVSDRAYPLTGAHNFTDNTGEAKMQEYANGKSKKIRDGFYSYTWTFEAPLEFYKQVKKLDKQHGRFSALFVDPASNGIVGVEVRSKTSASGFKGFKLSTLEVSQRKATTNEAIASFDVKIVFDNNQQFDEDAVVVVLDNTVNVGELEGLIPLTLNPAPAPATPITNAGLVHLQVLAGTGNFVSQYASQLAVPAAWVATRLDTGAVIPITAVVATALGWEITLTTASLPAAGGAIELGIASNAALSAAILVDTFDKGNKVVLIRP